MKEKIMKSLPQNVIDICNILENNGEEAWVVGGGVRDALLGREVADWDITTSASPKKVEELFGKSFGNGINFGIPFINYNGDSYEIAQFRKDLNTDGRFCETEVALSIEEDLCRRDFTINAIAYRPFTDHLTCPDGAMNDITKKIIRTVGYPFLRFEEDVLRILRMYRFSSTLYFDIEHETRQAAKNISTKEIFSILSGERIKKEFLKLLCGDNVVKTLIMMKEDGVLELLFPELKQMFDFNQNNPHHDKDLFLHSLFVVKYSPKNDLLRFAALFHDVGKPNCKTIDKFGISHFRDHASKSMDITIDVLKRLKFSNEEFDYIINLIWQHDFYVEKASTMRKFANKFGIDFAYDVAKLRRADILAQSTLDMDKKLKNVDFMEHVLLEIEEKKECFSLKNLLLNGNDLIVLGMKPGKEIGEMLDYLLNLVLENPELNDKETLQKIVQAKMF